MEVWPNLFFRLLLAGSVGSVLLYLLVCLILWSQQRHFIFQPERIIQTTPAVYQLKYQDVYLPVTNSDGVANHLHGWWIPAAQPDSKVLLYLHGTGANIGANVEHARRLHQLGFSVLLIDYRGYGHSGGKFPSETQVYQDAEIAWNYLIQQQIKPQQIFIYGHSLGGAIAINLAIHHPEAAGLMVESTFTSMSEMARRNSRFWFVPTDLLLTQRFASLDKISLLKLPILLLHGTADHTVPFQMSQRLFAAAPTTKELVLIPGGDHNNNAQVNGARYRQAVQAFVTQTCTVTHRGC
ncbi:alpha/beta fold hydrolase [Leptolyngbya sp. FACHB-261]|nr:alpha/beta fold hydrolase [Leptolyngbya sp. FACHB-261]